MLYRMLAGKPPFAAPGTGELMAMHIYMQPPPLGEADRALPDTLVQLVHRMLAKKREERPSMSQVASELERIGAKHTGATAAVPAPSPTNQPAGSSAAAHQAVSANESATVLSDTGKPHIPVPASSPPGPAKRRPVGVMVAGGLLLLIGSGLIGYRFLLPPSPQPAKPVAVGPQDPATPTKPQPAPPAKPRNINWKIESDPTGAQIYRLDKNELLGTTPLRSQQPAESGQIDLELRLKGYLPLKLTLSGSSDEERTQLKLESERSARKRDKKRKSSAQ
jgi:serine/threonine protein kinase